MNTWKLDHEHSDSRDFRNERDDNRYDTNYHAQRIGSEYNQYTNESKGKDHWNNQPTSSTYSKGQYHKGTRGGKGSRGGRGKGKRSKNSKGAKGKNGAKRKFHDSEQPHYPKTRNVNDEHPVDSEISALPTREQTKRKQLPPNTDPTKPSKTEEYKKRKTQESTSSKYSETRNADEQKNAGNSCKVPFLAALTEQGQFIYNKSQEEIIEILTAWRMRDFSSNCNKDYQKNIDEFVTNISKRLLVTVDRSQNADELKTFDRIFLKRTLQKMWQYQNIIVKSEVIRAILDECFEDTPTETSTLLSLKFIKNSGNEVELSRGEISKISIDGVLIATLITGVYDPPIDKTEFTPKKDATQTFTGWGSPTTTFNLCQKTKSLLVKAGCNQYNDNSPSTVKSTQETRDFLASSSSDQGNDKPTSDSTTPMSILSDSNALDDESDIQKDLNEQIEHLQSNSAEDEFTAKMNNEETERQINELRIKNQEKTLMLHKLREEKKEKRRQLANLHENIKKSLSDASKKLINRTMTKVKTQLASDSINYYEETLKLLTSLTSKLDAIMNENAHNTLIFADKINEKERTQAVLESCEELEAKVNASYDKVSILKLEKEEELKRLQSLILVDKEKEFEQQIEEVKYQYSKETDELRSLFDKQTETLRSKTKHEAKTLESTETRNLRSEKWKEAQRKTELFINIEQHKMNIEIDTELTKTLKSESEKEIQNQAEQLAAYNTTLKDDKPLEQELLPDVSQELILSNPVQNEDKNEQKSTDPTKDKSSNIPRYTQQTSNSKDEQAKNLIDIMNAEAPDTNLEDGKWGDMMDNKHVDDGDESEEVFETVKGKETKKKERRLRAQTSKSASSSKGDKKETAEETKTAEQANEQKPERAKRLSNKRGKEERKTTSNDPKRLKDKKADFFGNTPK